MVLRRVGTYGLAAVVLVVAAIMLFAAPAWAQGSQQRQPVSEAQKDRIERLSDAEAEDRFVQAAQTSDSSGDLAGETARVNDRRVVIPESNCRVDDDATIVFKVSEREVVGVANDEGSVTISSNNREVIVSGSGIDKDDKPLTVLSSTGIDCGDPDDDDGFDDELLLLLLLELLEDDDGDNGNGDGGNGGGNGNGDDDDQYDDENSEDLDEDGDVDQEDELLEAENELNGEDTDGEDTLGDDFDDGEDGPVSATAEDGQAEASTPGAVASAGGDPDELEPLTSTPDDVVDEVPTSGPLPNTGGMPILYWLVPLAGLLMLAGLPVYRWAKRRE